MEFDTEFAPVIIKLTAQNEVDFFHNMLSEVDSDMVDYFAVSQEIGELEMELCGYSSGDVYGAEAMYYPPLEESVAEACSEYDKVVAYRHSPQRLEQTMQREHPCKGGCEACTGCNASDSQEDYENDVSKRLDEELFNFFKIHNTRK